MGLAHDIEASAHEPSTRKSTVERWLDGLDTDDRAAAEAVLADLDGWKHTDVFKLFCRNGMTAVHIATFGAWRRQHYDAQR